ncbi:MAG: hypothetical protein ACPL3C_01195, partial [Pyrobaculum sp.]
MIYCFFCGRPLNVYNIVKIRSELSLDLYVYACDECLSKYSDLILEVVKRGEKTPYLPGGNNR